MIATKQNPPDVPEAHPMTLELVREFQRRMAAMIDAVQQGIWQGGSRDVLGYATDYAFGQQRGVQTLVLKTKHRSSYVRLHWDTVMGDGAAELLAVESTVKDAIRELG
jgi:NH3-dependent NAD+ synthetase